MDKETRFRRQSYEIYPKKNLGTILTVIIGAVALYQFAERFNLRQNIIFYLILVLIISNFFLYIVIKRLGKLINNYNHLFVEYERIIDNRDSLKKLAESKNNEIEQLNNEINVLQAKAHLLLHFVYAEDKPAKDIVTESLSLDYGEVDDYGK